MVAARLPAVASVLFFWTLLLIVASDVFLPRIDSCDGRLVHIGIRERSLSQNHCRLAFPTGDTTSDGASWRELELAASLRDGEVLLVLVDDTLFRETIVRISREPALPSGLLVLEGALAARPGNRVAAWPLPCLDGAAGTMRGLRLRRGEDVVTVHLDGGDGGACTEEVPVEGDGRSLELAMLPPQSRHLHRRVQVRRVLLAGGQTAPPRPWKAWARHPLALLLIAAAATALLVPARLAVPLLLPYLGRHRPVELAVIVLGCAAILAAYGAAVAGAQMHPFADEIRAKVRVMAAAPPLAVLLATVIWDRLLLAVPRLRGAGTAWGMTLRAGVLSAVVLLALLAFIALNRTADSAGAVHPPGEDDVLRIACLGGSSTRGYPFPHGWSGGAWPEKLARGLERGAAGAGERPLTVWNLGVDGRGIVELVDSLERDVMAHQPTHVVIDSVVNNGVGREEVLRAELLRAADLVRQAGLPPSSLILVKEPTRDMLGIDLVSAPPATYYEVIDEVAAETGAVVVDPGPAFRANRDECLFLDDVHLSARGHALLAGLVMAEIEPAAITGGR